MKAIQYTAPRQFAVVDLPKPEPGPHQVVIRVKACGICKTDLTIHDGSFLAKFPLVNGHEFAGVIDSVGSAVTEWKVGDRVTADNTELCGYCEPCRSDKPLYCENFNSHGCNMPGGFAEYVLINHDKVFALSDKLSFEEATFTEPTACAVHGVDRIAPRFGDSILMFGAGPTGIILAQLLRRAGAGRMVIADPHADKLDILRKYGFTDLVVMDKADPSKHTAEIKAIMPKGTLSTWAARLWPTASAPPTPRYPSAPTTFSARSTPSSAPSPRPTALAGRWSIWRAARCRSRS